MSTVYAPTYQSTQTISHLEHYKITQTSESIERNKRIAAAIPMIMEIIRQLDDAKRLAAIELATKKMNEFGYPVTINETTKREKLKIELEKFREFLDAKFPSRSMTEIQKNEWITKIALVVIGFLAFFTALMLATWLPLKFLI